MRLIRDLYFNRGYSTLGSRTGRYSLRQVEYFYQARPVFHGNGAGS